MLKRILALAAFAIALTANVAAFAENDSNRANLTINNTASGTMLNESEVKANYLHSGTNWIKFRGGGTLWGKANPNFENMNMRSKNGNLPSNPYPGFNPAMRNGAVNSSMRLNASNVKNSIEEENVWKKSGNN
jgi:hypothetical protein